MRLLSAGVFIIQLGTLITGKSELSMHATVHALVSKCPRELGIIAVLIFIAEQI